MSGVSAAAFAETSDAPPETAIGAAASEVAGAEAAPIIAAAADGALPLPGSTRSCTLRGWPIGAAEVPDFVAAMSSSLGTRPSSMKSNSLRAIGAAAPAPQPAFSTITATAICGSASGATSTGGPPATR